MGNVTSHTGHGTASGLIGSTVRDGGESGTVDIVGTLPDDVAFQVLDHLDFDDIERVKQVCRCGEIPPNSPSLAPSLPLPLPPPAPGHS